ncbi:MAG: serine phosphatase RsbU (regulator of sigma subunit) [Parvicellaceae bacterium]
MKLFLIFLALFPYLSFGQLSGDQIERIEKYKSIIETADNDSNIVNAYLAWDYEIYISDPELDFDLNKKIETLCTYNLARQTPASERHYYLNQMARSLNNLGLIYHDHGDYGMAIDCHTGSLKIKEQIKDKAGISGSLNNIGMIYWAQDDSKMALEYYHKSIAIATELNDKLGIATTLNNIGIIYESDKDYENAIDYHLRSLALREELDDKNGIGTSHGNIGILYRDQEKFNLAHDYFTQSLDIYEAMSDKKGMAFSLNNSGLTHLRQENYQAAIESSSRALTIAEQVDGATEIKDAAEILYLAYKAIGNNLKALEMHEQYMLMINSIRSEENRNEVIKQKFKYDFAKKEAIEKANHEAELKRRDDVAEEKQTNLNIIISSVSIGLVLVIIFTIFLLNRFRLIRKQKALIEEQKKTVDHAYDELEEKNNEITDSITYARRIQEAIMPPMSLVEDTFADSFILYKPKDIVAGDFYWMETVLTEAEPIIIYAAADCTGHGVPGAMVSVVCDNAMNRAVREFGRTDPGEILTKTRELVVQTFENSENDVKDGMDVSLCAIQGSILKFAGANNALWVIRNGALMETKASKQAIGIVDNPIPYPTHEFELKKGDLIYVFTDGFVDQFGGERGKKFKPANLRKLLLSIHDLPMKEQKKTIDEAFETWRGSLEQVDDVCFFAVRF